MFYWRPTSHTFCFSSFHNSSLLTSFSFSIPTYQFLSHANCWSVFDIYTILPEKKRVLFTNMRIACLFYYKIITLSKQMFNEINLIPFYYILFFACLLLILVFCYFSFVHIVAFFLYVLLITAKKKTLDNFDPITTILLTCITYTDSNIYFRNLNFFFI